MDKICGPKLSALEVFHCTNLVFATSMCTLISQKVCLSLQCVYPSISSPKKVYILHFLPPINPQLTEVKETAPPSTLDLSHHQHEEEMEELRAEVEKKSRMLLEVKGYLKQLAEREREREGGAAGSGSQRERCSQRTSQDGELLLELPCNSKS